MRDRDHVASRVPARTVGSTSARTQPRAPVVSLHRRAGNRALAAALVARRAEPGEGQVGTSVGQGPAPERQIVDPGTGRSVRRLKVTGLPDAFTDWAIVLLPSTPPPAGKPVDILLHLHGFSPGYEGLGHTEGKQPNTDADDIDLYRIAPQLAASGRPMIGILPQGSALSDFNADDPKKNKKQNASSKAFDADSYITAVFKRLGDMGAWRGGGAPVPGPVALSGHSGADQPIAQMVSSDLGPDKLSALFLFDTMYPGAGFEKTIWNAIERRLDQDLSALRAVQSGATGGKAAAEPLMVEWVRANGFRVYNVHGGFYGKSSEHLFAKRTEWLRANKGVVGAKGSPVHQAILDNIRITPGKGGHWNIISADDHLRTAIDMLPGQQPNAAPGGTAVQKSDQKSVQRQPAPGPAPAPAPGPAPAPAPPPRLTPAQQVAAASGRVRDLVRAAAAPLVGTANGDDIAGILTQQLISRDPNPSAALRRRAPTHPALPLYDVLYGTDVVTDLATIDTRSTSRKAADETRRRLFHSVLAGLVTDVTPRTAVAAPATPLNEATQIAGERALVPNALPFIADGLTWADVRVGVITEFGGLVSGTRTALARANTYYGSLQRPTFRNVTQNTRVHPDLNAAFVRANTMIDARLAATAEPQRTQITAAIREALGRNTFSAVLRPNANAPHRLSDHSFGFAIDIDSKRNPNIGKGGGLDAVQDVTQDNPRPGSVIGRTGAQVEATATSLRDISNEYKDAMANDVSLAPVLLRLANEARAAVRPPLPALASGTALVAAVVLGRTAPRAAALRDAIWPEGVPAPAPAPVPAPAPPGGGRAPRPPAAPPRPAPPATIAAMEVRIERIGAAYRASFAGTGRTTRVGMATEATKGSVAAHGFMTLPSILVGGLAGSDGGNLRWLGAENVADFMHFDLTPRPPLFTEGAVVDPAPPDTTTHLPGPGS